jgi:hypothetical protein
MNINLENSNYSQENEIENQRRGFNIEKDKIFMSFRTLINTELPFS